MRKNVKAIAAAVVLALVVTACTGGATQAPETMEMPVAETTTTLAAETTTTEVAPTESTMTETPAVEEVEAVEPGPVYSSIVAAACADDAHFAGTIEAMAQGAYDADPDRVKSAIFSIELTQGPTSASAGVEIGGEVYWIEHYDESVYYDAYGAYRERDTLQGARCDVLDSFQQRLRVGDNLPVTENTLIGEWSAYVQDLIDVIGTSESYMETSVFVEPGVVAVVTFSLSRIGKEFREEYVPSSRSVSVTGEGASLEEAVEDFYANTADLLVRLAAAEEAADVSDASSLLDGAVASGCANFGTIFATTAFITEQSFDRGGITSDAYSFRSSMYSGRERVVFHIDLGGYISPYDTFAYHKDEYGSGAWDDTADGAMCAALSKMFDVMGIRSALPTAYNATAQSWWEDVQSLVTRARTDKSSVEVTAFVDPDAGVFLYLEVTYASVLPVIEYVPHSDTLLVIGSGATLEEAVEDFLANAEELLGTPEPTESTTPQSADPPSGF